MSISKAMPSFSQFELLLKKYFPDRLSVRQLQQFKTAMEAYLYWNEKVNVISRKDIENLAERHFLHALSIGKVIDFEDNTKILDVGTGGGFPGIPLAILFPGVQFHLVDSIRKKIKVVQNIVHLLGLENVHYSVHRVSDIDDSYDFVTGRAVTSIPKILAWLKGKVHCEQRNRLENGLLYLKGGDKPTRKELKKRRFEVFEISDYFEEDYFSSKYLVHIPFCE